MKVLVCDDHALLAEVLAARLRGRGHEVRVVSTPEDAITAAASDATDMCLMDLRFPGRPLAGLHAIPELRRASPRTAVLLISGAMTDETAHAAVAAGAHGVAGKDISLPRLEAALDQIAAGRVLVSRDLSRAGGRGCLTPREREVLDLVANGLSTAQIASALDLSVRTVRGYVEAVLGKLGVHSRLDAATLAGQLIPEPRPSAAEVGAR